MHVNRAFHWTDRDAMLAFAAERPFATIAATTELGPRVAHAPVVVAHDTLRFHLARANPVARAAASSAPLLALFNGPDAYVSPDWYAGADQVPTWNYLAVECDGVARTLDDAGLVTLLDDLSAIHEARLAPKPAWTRSKMTPAIFDRMLGAIVGFEMTVTAIRGTAKLSQNKPAADVAGAAAGVEAAGNAEVAALMRRFQRA